jgi:hypothetical protein
VRSSALNAANSRGNLVLPLFCLAAVVANQAVFRFGAMSPLWVLVLLLTVGALYWVAPDVTHPEKAAARESLRPANVLIAILALAPLLADLAIGWNREFPFSGDTWFHVGQSYRMAYWWLSPVHSGNVSLPSLDDVRHLTSRPFAALGSRIVVLLVIVTVTALLYRRWRAVALGFATIAIVTWGCFEATIFLRYPGARYFIDLPFLGPAFALSDLELAGRLANVGGALCWLFVLRPWLIGRWPDLRILPVAVLLLWQKDMIYYFDSVYLEPWALIFSLLAAELLIAKGRDGAPAACLCIGAAATFKEPFILALPFVWLAGEPWRRTWRDLVQLSAAAVAAGMPFVVYVAARKSVDITELGSNRFVELSMSTDALRNYVSQLAKQLAITFPGSSGLLVIASLLLIVVTLVYYPERRIALASLLGAACFIALLFIFDRTSQRWAGYFRFVMCSLPFLTCGVLALGRSLPTRWALALAAVVVLLQAPSAYTALAFSAGPATGRNFLEYYDSGLIFPIKSLTAEAQRAGALSRGAPILANSIDSTLRSFPGSGITYGPVGELYCKCEANHPNVLALFIRFTNMSAFLATHQQPADSRYGMWQKTDSQRDICLAQLKQSCGHVFSRVESGELVGALGTQR